MTSMVFNGHLIAREAAAAGTAIDKPLFLNRTLQKALLAKAAPRPEERALFTDLRSVATKLLIPIDPNNLKAGARTVFVGQRDWVKLLAEGANLDPDAQGRDIQCLKLIDQLPGFDPFLMREWLARAGVEADDAFFRILPHEVRAMEAFVAREIGGLIHIALGAEAQGEEAQALVARLMGGKADSRLAPIQAVLKMEEEDFKQAMFAWKGFLYYKWVRADLGSASARALVEMDQALPGPAVTGRDADMARDRATNLRHAVEVAVIEADKVLKRYDHAYAQFTRGRDPAPFIGFLQEAAMLFMKLGFSMGVMSHLGQTWRREADLLGHGVRMPPSRLADLLDDLSLTIRYEDLAMFA